MSEVREKIVAASLDLLKTEGLSALSLREVARRAGVSHQAPYHHFSDREAILAELAKRGFEDLLTYMRRTIDVPVEKRLRSMAHAYVEFARDHPDQFRLMFRTELVDLSCYPDAKTAAEETFALLLATAGATHADPQSELREAITLWAFVHGLSTLLLEWKLKEVFGATPASQEAMVKSVIDSFANRIASRG